MRTARALTVWEGIDAKKNCPKKIQNLVLGGVLSPGGAYLVLGGILSPGGVLSPGAYLVLGGCT